MKMSGKKFGYLIVIVFMILILLINYNNNVTKRITKEIQVNNVEMTENGIVIQLNINGELNYYYYEDK